MGNMSSRTIVRKIEVCITTLFVGGHRLPDFYNKLLFQNIVAVGNVTIVVVVVTIV